MPHEAIHSAEWANSLKHFREKSRPTSTLRQRLFPFCLSASTICFALGAVQIQSEPNIVVADSYSSPKFGELRVKGVCDVQESSVSCWDWNRNPSKSLSDEVSTYLLQLAKTSNGFNSRISIRYKRKNRIAVVSASENIYDSTASARVQQFASADGSSVMDLHQFDQSGAPATDHYLIFSADPKAESTSLFAKLLIKSGSPVDIPPTVGASATTGGETITVASITPSDRLGMHAMMSMPGKHWEVLFKLSGDRQSPTRDFQAEPVNAKGEQIFWADDAGKPVDAPNVGLSKTKNASPNMPIGHPVFMGFTSSYQPDIDGRISGCGVDPKYFPAFKITLSEPKSVEFKGIPLDPKR